MRKFFERRAVRAVGIGALLVVVVALLFLLLNWYIAPTKLSDKKDLVLAMAQILAGTALLSGLYFTWRTLQVNREGQITERFTRAIDQLGRSEELEIRLGGIYALERIARDSEQDHWAIMEVLTGYVRQHARRRAEEEQEEEPPTVPPPAPDIQAILTVLRRRTRSFGHGESEPLDLHKAFISQADLRGVNLSGANLSEADLSGADLSGADLSRADLGRANLWAADLPGANLSEANLYGADLKGTDLKGTDLKGTDFREVTGLERAQLVEAYGDEYTTLLPSGLFPPGTWRTRRPTNR